MDLCFIIDSSGSIRDNNPPGGQRDNWQLQLDFLSQLIDLFIIGPDATKVGAVVFSEEVNLAFSLDTYTDAQSVKKAINELAYFGLTTNTPEGFKVTREQCFNTANGDRSDVQNLAIFISDGVPWPFYRRDPAVKEAEALKAASVSLVAIGVTHVIDKDFLQTISSRPHKQDQNFFVATDFKVLSKIRRSVGEGTCEIVEGSKYSSQQGICLIHGRYDACITKNDEFAHRYKVVSKLKCMLHDAETVYIFYLCTQINGTFVPPCCTCVISSVRIDWLKTKCTSQLSVHRFNSTFVFYPLV